MASAGGQRAQDMVKLPAMILLGVTPFAIILSLIYFFYVKPAFYNAVIQNVQPSSSSTASDRLPDYSHSVLDYLLLVVGLGGAGFIMFGAAQMMRLKAWPIAMAACIASIVPFVYAGTGCCFILGAPGGIWGLIILLKPEVKAAFRA